MRFVAPDGATVRTGANIEAAGKAGFQRADLMDYGSLYGMGAYFGEDHTATDLVKLTTLTENGIAEARYGQRFAALPASHQVAVKTAMRRAPQGIDLTHLVVTLPAGVAEAAGTLRSRIAAALLKSDFAQSWTQVHSLDPAAAQTAAVYEHGYAYARNQAFYSTTTFWQWMRMSGDIVFAAGALLMAWDFLLQLLGRSAAPAMGGGGALT